MKENILKKLLKNKKGIEIQMLLYIIIAVIVLAVGIIAYFYLTEGGKGLLASLKNLLRFGAG